MTKRKDLKETESCNKYLDFVLILLLVPILYTCLSFAVPFNLFFIFDDCFYGCATMENRLNCVTSCPVILDDDLTIYKREINNLFHREFKRID
eukprot:snap_masked-scaffold_25-processed-gene-2.27-mRNA-1 protein AED:1.00 eAED:1.00 QI:0/0/0/0/1/1/2/0/92